ncbi:MAG: hypothetical protein Q9165_002934 [Trypethelium subeluteriae]
MTNTKETVSFDEIIQEGRRKRKFQAMADEILGKGRKSNAAAANSKVNRNVPTGPASTVASRGGIVKSSSRLDRGNRAYASLQSELSKDEEASQVNIVGNGKGDNIHIKGMAGPYIVVASNFAPGTTAADIESVMAAVGGEMLSCRLISSSPTVMAEMQFVDKVGAESIISTFNNKKADGRLLHVYMKSGGPSPAAPSTRARQDDPAPLVERDVMDVDERIPTGPASDRANRDRYERPNRRYDIQDGRYGFGSGREWYDGRDYRRDREERGLVSDSLIGNRSYGR